MDFQMILDWAIAQFPLAKDILAGVGSLVFVMSAIVKLTPSQDDDHFLEKLKGVPLIGRLYEILERFSLFSRKE